MDKFKESWGYRHLPEILFYSFAFLCMMMFVLIQPFGEGPDEINRYRVVTYISNHGRLPVGNDPEVLIPGYGGSYAFQPIFTYIIQGFLLRFLRLFTNSAGFLLTAARMVNVAFGMLAAYYTLKLSRLLFTQRLTQWLFACFVVFLPQNLFIHTYVNTDSCAALSVVMMFYAVLSGMRRQFHISDCLQLATGIVLCALSYYNAYGAVLVCMVLFAAGFIRNIPAGVIAYDGTASPQERTVYDWKDLLRKGALISAIVIVGAGWWFLRNAILYNGDFLGMAARNICVEATSTPEYHPLLRSTYQSQGIPILTMVFGTDFFVLLTRSFVAMFGPMNLPTHYFIYIFYNRIFLIGILMALVPAGEGQYLDWQKQYQRFLTNACFAVACIIPIFLCVFYSYSWDYQPQGRYLLPMAVPFLYFVTLGISRLLSLLRQLCARFNFRAAEEKAPAVIQGILIFLTASALFYSVFCIMIPHYLGG